MAGKEKKTPVKSTGSTPKMNYTKAELNKFNKDKLMELFLEAQDYTASLQEKIDSLTTKLDALTVRVDAQEKADSSPSSKQMENLERDSYAIQQYSRRECIEIAGIPTSIPNENVEAKCIEIINAIGRSPPQVIPTFPDISRHFPPIFDISRHFPPIFDISRPIFFAGMSRKMRAN